MRSCVTLQPVQRLRALPLPMLWTPRLNVLPCPYVRCLVMCNACPVQDEFAQVLSRHTGRDVCELFAFRKPRHGLGKGRKNASTVLALTPKQHAVMYALAG